MIIGSLGLGSFAESSDSDLCDQSIEQVASTSIVPREVIFKIARLKVVGVSMGAMSVGLGHSITVAKDIF